MKKLLILLVVAAVPFGAKAGFIGTSEQAILTVSDVSKLGDEKSVVMKGSIEKHISKDKYQFVDGTGRIVVEIEGDKWRGLDITPEDTVMIVGETDKDWFRDVRVEVDSIQKIPTSGK
jgi:uncharacterized protein (TIGR00156 family)